jgi:hypothetical protein
MFQIMPLTYDWPYSERPTRCYKALSTATIALVGSISKIWMSKSQHVRYIELYSSVILGYLTSVRIENGKCSPFLIICQASMNLSYFLTGDVLAKAILHRDPKRGMVTTANHHSCKIDTVLLCHCS